MNPNSSNHADASDNLLTPKEVANALKTSVSTLARTRKHKYGKAPVLPFVKLGARIIRYRKADVEKYLETCTER
jgi:excisionase family DNA binding protein